MKSLMPVFAVVVSGLLSTGSAFASSPGANVLTVSLSGNGIFATSAVVRDGSGAQIATLNCDTANEGFAFEGHVTVSCGDITGTIAEGGDGGVQLSKDGQSISLRCRGQVAPGQFYPTTCN